MATRRFSVYALAAVLLASLAGSAAARSLGRAHWAIVNGHKIYYETGGSGRPLLLLHGGGASAVESFESQLDEFTRGHRVIAPEQVGQGHSPDIDAPLSYAAMMEDTAALLQQLHIADIDVVGWSDGGILALMLAIHYPQLVHSVVVSGTNISPDGLLDSELAALRDAADTADIHGKLRQLWRSSPTRDELNWTLLQQLQKPVLVLAGDNDVIKPTHTRAIYHALPRAQLIVLPDTGHATFTQRPEIVNPAVLEFIANN
jgi:pimeloyl-ACP methyl ester carboxylesterase